MEKVDHPAHASVQSPAQGVFVLLCQVMLFCNVGGGGLEGGWGHEGDTVEHAAFTVHTVLYS